MPIIHNKGMLDLIWKGMTLPRSGDVRQWKFTIWNNGTQRTSGVAGAVDTITYTVTSFSDINDESPVDPWLWRRMNFGISNSALTLANINESNPMIFDPKSASWGDVDEVRIETRIGSGTWYLFARVYLYPVPEILANQTLQIQDLILRFFGGFSYGTMKNFVIDGVSGPTVSPTLADTLTNGTVYWMSLHEDASASYTEYNYTGYARQPVRLWKYAGKIYLQTAVVFPQNGGTEFFNVAACRINTNSTIGNSTVPGGNTAAVTFDFNGATAGQQIATGQTPFINPEFSAVRIV